MNTRTLVSILIFIIISPLYANTDKIFQLEITSSYKYTYSRTMGHKNEILFHGKQHFSDHLDIGAGFSTAFNSLPENIFINFDINNYPSFLRYRLSLLSRDFPEYKIRENSIYPTISLLTRNIELELGMSFRILETDVQTFTAHTLYRLQFNILDRKHYGLFFKMSNFDLYNAGNITELYYTLGNTVKINDHFQIQADLGFHNPGQIAFASHYSTFFGQIGVEYNL